MTEAELLVERWMAAANELALLFAREPDAKVEAALARMRQHLIDEFCALFPKADPETIAAGVDSIIAEIQKQRREIENGGAMPRGLN
jgi:hypothetical protein